LTQNILSAPVYDSKSKSYVGCLELRDVLAEILRGVEKKSPPEGVRSPTSSSSSSSSSPSDGDDDENESSFSSSSSSFSSSSERDIKKSVLYRFTPTLTVQDLARSHPFTSVTSKSTLAEASRLLCQVSCHKVPVIKEDRRCYSILSQSAILAFINQHKKQLEPELSQWLETINLGFKDVITVNTEQTARDAFTSMAEHNISGLGVVDGDGKLVNTTSARDIKHFALADRDDVSLDVDVLEYLSQIRRRLSPSKTRVAVSSVRKNDSLSRVMGILCSTKYHRLFMVDHLGKPIGVVSITDILTFALRG